MRGFVAFVIIGASVSMLIPFPELWPLTVALFALAIVLNPRDRGGKLNRRREP
jgi:hypothetical protein